MGGINKVSSILLIFLGLGINLDLLKAQEITRFIIRQDNCSTKCSTGYLKKLDTCIFSFDIGFKETLPDFSSVIFEVKEERSNIFNDLQTLDMKTDCKGYMENADFYCTEVDMNIFTITIKATNLTKYSKAEGRVYITTLKGPKIYSNLIHFPSSHESTDAIGTLTINGKNMSSDQFCNDTIKGNDLNIEFNCISEATPCIVQIKVNEKVVVQQRKNNATYAYKFQSTSAANVDVQFAACRLDGNYNSINCTIKTEYIHNEENAISNVYIGIGITVAAVVTAVLILIILLIYRYRSRGTKQSNTARNIEDQELKSIVHINAVEKELWTPLLFASYQGHLLTVQTLVKYGANVNAKDSKNVSSLMLASLNGHMDIVEYLKNENANIDEKDENGYTALMISAERGCCENFKKLIDLGADVNECKNDGWTVLMVASKSGHNEMVRHLIDKGVDVHRRSNDNLTAMMVASHYGHNEIVRMLSEKGGDVNETIPNVSWECKEFKESVRTTSFANGDGFVTESQRRKTIHKSRKIIFNEIKSGKGNMLKHSLSTDKLNNKTDEVCVHERSKDEELETQVPLLNDINNLDKTDDRGWTDLMLASQNGNIQSVKQLLKCGSSASIKAKTGWNSLMIASNNGNYEIVELLISKINNVNDKDKNGWTALMFASKMGYENIATLLYKKGANVNERDKEGLTPLMVAAKYGHTEIVSFLIKCKSKVSKKDNTGNTALMIASHRGHSEIVGLLIAQNSKVNKQNFRSLTALMLASQNGHDDTVKLLIKNKADVKIKTYNNWDALMFASQNGHHSTVSILLSEDALANARNAQEQTALMIASNNGHTETVKTLIPGSKIKEI